MPTQNMQSKILCDEITLLQDDMRLSNIAMQALVEIH